jgi:flavodoxin
LQPGGARQDFINKLLEGGTMKRAITVLVMVLAAGYVFAEEMADSAVKVKTNNTTEEATLKKIDTGKKILVVYYSRTGNTERVGKDIAECFGADIEKVVDKKNRKGFFGFIGAGQAATFKRRTRIEPLKRDPSQYDIIIIGTPIWALSMTPAIRTYLTQTKGKLKSVAFFVTSAGTSAKKIVASMEKLSGKKSLNAVGFVSEELEDNTKYSAKLAKFLEFFSIN